ncbi:MAG: hypothetical protein RLZZ200_2995, partial [Pseudomonadota bacterium]
MRFTKIRPPVQFLRGAACVSLVAISLLFAACTTTQGGAGEAEPPVFEEALGAEEPIEPSMDDESDGPEEGAGEVPLAVAASEPPARPIENVIVEGVRPRHAVIRDLVAEGQALLRGVELQYFFTGKGKRETLSGRPVAFALWSETAKDWTVAHIEIPRPPIKWSPGGRPLEFRVRTPGIQARHVKGTGAERLMFAFSRDGEPLKVYGRRFPVFDNALLRKRRWRDVAATARPIVYLPYTEDTLDPDFVSGGRDFLLGTARRAIGALREARVPSAAFPGKLMADVVPAEIVTTLAVIEQTDDTDFLTKGRAAFEEVLSHYGLKREEAFRYSVSSADALGPMQFTNRRGNGTYALVVRRCRGAGLEPDFERGATDLLNAMKAAICLFDIELAQMRAEIREAYQDNPPVLGIFPVAAYNGGPRNVMKLYRVLDR